MQHIRIPGKPLPDFEYLKKQGNFPALVQLLGHEDVNVRQHAARVLGESGGAAVPALLASLHSRDASVRLGAVEILGATQDPRAVQPLAMVLKTDPLTEVRWAAALALGGSGAAGAIPPLVDSLHDKNRYIRYGAAIALRQLGWSPETDTEKAYQRIAMQEWDRLRELGTAAAAPLADMYRDDDPATRTTISTLLGQMGVPHSPTVFQPALTDRNPGVRWKAVLAAMNSGIATHYLPVILARRERTGPNPAAAAILNFLFLGIGYNYLGKWWGFPVFMSYMSIIVLAQLATGPFLPYLIAYPITAVIALHTYYWARQSADRQ
jgi:HEAT repeat protein